PAWVRGRRLAWAAGSCGCEATRRISGTRCCTTSWRSPGGTRGPSSRASTTRLPTCIRCRSSVYALGATDQRTWPPSRDLRTPPIWRRTRWWWASRLTAAGTKRPAARRMVGNMSKLRIALALGSGGLRGIAHIGVLRALAEAEIQPTVYAGSSAGALVAAAAAHDLTLSEMESIAARLHRKSLFRI